MAIKTFILYFAPFLAGSIALFAVVKQYAVTFANKGKAPFWYGTLASSLSSLVAFGVTYATNNLFVVFWLMAGLYLLFGIIHLAITHKKYFRHPREPRNKLLTAELLFGLSVICFSIVAFAALQYFFKDKGFLFYPVLLSTVFFFVPILVYHTFIAAYTIPRPVYVTWEYPLSPIELPDEKENEELLVIGFEIAKKGGDMNRTYFRAKAPADMILGDLFYHFINDYNEVQSETPIDYLNKDRLAYNWFFRAKPRWYTFSSVLNPEKTVRENNIKENTVIICERGAV